MNQNPNSQRAYEMIPAFPASLICCIMLVESFFVDDSDGGISIDFRCMYSPPSEDVTDGGDAFCWLLSMVCDGSAIRKGRRPTTRVVGAKASELGKRRKEATREKRAARFVIIFIVVLKLCLIRKELGAIC